MKTLKLFLWVVLLAPWFLGAMESTKTEELNEDVWGLRTLFSENNSACPSCGHDLTAAPVGLAAQSAAVTAVTSDISMPGRKHLLWCPCCNEVMVLLMVGTCVMIVIPLIKLKYALEREFDLTFGPYIDRGR